MAKLLSTETWKKRRLYVKLCKIRLYSFRRHHHHHHHHHRHRHHNHHHCRQHRPRKKHCSPETDSWGGGGWGGWILKENLAAQISRQKNRHQLLAQSRNTMSKLYMSVFSFWAMHFISTEFFQCPYLQFALAFSASKVHSVVRIFFSSRRLKARLGHRLG